MAELEERVPALRRPPERLGFPSVHVVLEHRIQLRGAECACALQQLVLQCLDRPVGAVGRAEPARVLLERSVQDASLTVLRIDALHVVVAVAPQRLLSLGIDRVPHLATGEPRHEVHGIARLRARGRQHLAHLRTELRKHGAVTEPSLQLLASFGHTVISGVSVLFDGRLSTAIALSTVDQPQPTPRSVS